MELSVSESKVKFIKVVALIIFFYGISTTVLGDAPNVRVCFTPGEDYTSQIVNVLDHAKSSILVQAYSFTSAPIARALVNANRRGVKVKIILDKSQWRSNKYSSSTFFGHEGLPVWIDYRPAIAHNKVMIIDNRIVLGGSFNYTRAA